MSDFSFGLSHCSCSGMAVNGGKMMWSSSPGRRLTGDDVVSASGLAVNVVHWEVGHA